MKYFNFSCYFIKILTKTLAPAFGKKSCLAFFINDVLRLFLYYNNNNNNYLHAFNLPGGKYICTSMSAATTVVDVVVNYKTGLSFYDYYFYGLCLVCWGVMPAA